MLIDPYENDIKYLQEWRPLGTRLLALDPKTGVSTINDTIKNSLKYVFETGYQLTNDVYVKDSVFYNLINSKFYFIYAHYPQS